MRLPLIVVMSFCLTACPSGRPLPQSDHRLDQQLGWPDLSTVEQPARGDEAPRRDVAHGDLRASPDRPGPDLCKPACASKLCGAGNGCGGTCAAGSGCLYLDEEFSAPLDPASWSTSTGGGGTAGVAGGLLTLTVGSANAWADVHSIAALPASSVLEARVNVSAGQWFDHKGIGYADQRVGPNCNDPSAETEAAMWRGQDSDRFAEVAAAGTWDCQKTGSSYAAGWRTIKIERVGTSAVKVYEDGVQLIGFTSSLPKGGLPVRFSLYSYTSGPATAITLQVDWIKVRPL